MQEVLFPELNDPEQFMAAGHIELTFKRVLNQVKERVSRLFPQDGRMDPEDIRSLQLDE